MRSSQSRLIVAGSVALAVAGGVRADAHRLDELLQAARIGIDPGRVTIELDLTPGIAVAPRIVAEIDGNRDGSISADETRAYADRVLREIRLDLDDRAMAPALIESGSSPADALRRGEGSIRIRAMAALPALLPGDHRLRCRNTHHTDVGVYLANALVPASTRVGIVSQERDADQHEIVVRYMLSGEDSPAGSWRAGALGLVVASIIGVGWWRSRVYWLDA